jgi:hypothetical protein
MLGDTGEGGGGGEGIRAGTEQGRRGGGGAGRRTGSALRNLTICRDAVVGTCVPQQGLRSMPWISTRRTVLTSGGRDFALTRMPAGVFASCSRLYSCHRIGTAERTASFVACPHHSWAAIS